MRAFLGGRAFPREEFAIIGIGEATGVPVILLLEDGEVFTPEDYISLGYTNYEVWCVGASGGRGGTGMRRAEWRTMKTQEDMPSDIWADVVNEYNMTNGPDYVYTGSDRLTDVVMPSVGVISWDIAGDYVHWALTPEGLAEFQNRTHTANIIHYLEPLPFDSNFPALVGHTYVNGPVNPGPMRIGGGGGGGGLHVVHGLLVDLPSSLAVEVGLQGADGASGQLLQAAPWDPSPAWSALWYPQMNHARWDFLHRFPNGHPTLDLPAEGSPGGSSSFGDICQASGGKGGKPAIQWAGSTRQQYADGGQGGIGGSIVAGGGADGAVTNTSPGKDGSWDGVIGKGGGGGRGGASGSVDATEGGRGSLNFADTSVYGARGPLGTYFEKLRNYDPVTGDLIATIETPIAAPINPGSGGGARVPGNRKYGSRATGYSHDGVVLVRLTKLD